MGDFSFVEDKMWRETLTHDYNCLAYMDWFMLKGHDSTKSFMWDTTGPAWDHIRKKMHDDHSAASMACSFRVLERIAKIGWTGFVLEQTRR
jgi:hypothetical protein